ncbi:MAG: hypothetical protein HN478_16140 [Rhodospirillaceae bacterium]|mgnify:FL=1|jgi:hypothetical protein|nr:hypothetical protein [Rhodospirillaceae bacterium]MBT5195056.1 hypothetical protein [Rhodospirillaceae bacterium]MBT6431428.1 hypothetical protein [Rhodospirillaceae bacterium]MBT6987169.1 hypothetical protein [Rhodospirillaceae bacterium]MBT7757368.1 hypothetical protein [Rhodospirillaceae bacterium]
MTNVTFASLHAGMLERGPAKAGDMAGKAIKTVSPLPHNGPRPGEPRLGGPSAEFSQPQVQEPPIRALLDHVADWAALADGVTAPWSAPALVPVSAPTSAPPSVDTGPQSPPPKPKRRALTLRLEIDSHDRLRRVSTKTGRSCQDILFAAMNRYLDSLEPKI